MTCILLVDDEPDLVWAMRHSLHDEGYDVLTAYDGVEALLLAHAHRPDLIILDIIMPRLDGLAVCHRLRRDPLLASVPILFLSARSSVEERIAGLDEGGDDYLTKPFDLRELKSRIRAMLRRSAAATRVGPACESQDLLAWGPLVLNCHTRQVRVAGQAVQLTPAEFELLRFLMTHPGEIFSSEQLLREVWHYPAEFANPGLVRWHMKNLRTKIESDPAHPAYFRTVPHQGYILIEQAQS